MERRISYTAVCQMVEPYLEAMKQHASFDERSLNRRWSEVSSKKNGSTEQTSEGTANAPAHLLLTLAECTGGDVNEMINQCWSDPECRQAVADRIKAIRNQEAKGAKPYQKQTGEINDEPQPAEPHPERPFLKSIYPMLAASSIGMALGLGSAGLIETKTSTSPANSGSVAETTFVAPSGYHPNLYHPVASTKLDLDLQPNKLLKDQSKTPKIVLAFEARSGNYLLKIADHRGLLKVRNNVLLFYRNGDNGQFDPNTGLNHTLHEQIVRVTEPPEFQFAIGEGTTKISVMAAIENEQVLTEIARTHTVCIFYCYPDITFEHSETLPAEFRTGDKFVMHLNVINRGFAPAAAGHVSVRLTSTDPLLAPIEAGKQKYQKLEPDRNQELAIPVEIPNLAAGDYVGTITVDSENTSVERDEIFAGTWKQDLGKPFRPREADEKVIPANNFGTFQFRIVTSHPQ